LADLPDVNVWLALVSGGHEHHTASREWFDSASERGAVFCRVTQMGLLRLITNDKVMGSEVLGQRQAWSVYDSLCSDSRAAFDDEPPELEKSFRILTASSFPKTKSWTDAYLAAFATRRNFRVVSFDRGFKAFSELNALILGPK
jgi:toxin-antitoxin system PIN domain toxin